MFDPWRWTLRYIGLAALFAVIYFLVLSPVKKQALAAFKQIPGKLAARTLPDGAITVEASASGQGGAVLAPDAKQASQLKPNSPRR